LSFHQISVWPDEANLSLENNQNKPMRRIETNPNATLLLLIQLMSSESQIPKWKFIDAYLVMKSTETNPNANSLLLT